MRDFAMVRCRVWKSQKFKSLPDDGCRMFFMYLLSSTHSNAIGCYALEPGYVAADLDWTVELSKERLGVLRDHDLIVWDQDEGLVLVKNWFAVYRPQNEKHLMKVVKDLQAIPSKALREAAFNDLKKAASEVVFKIGDLWKKAINDGCGDTVSIGYPDDKPPQSDPESDSPDDRVSIGYPPNTETKTGTEPKPKPEPKTETQTENLNTRERASDPRGSPATRLEGRAVGGQSQNVEWMDRARDNLKAKAG